MTVSYTHLDVYKRQLYNNLNYLEDICALNNLDDVNKIIAGQELVLPALEGE